MKEDELFRKKMKEDCEYFNETFYACVLDKCKNCKDYKKKVIEK